MNNKRCKNCKFWTRRIEFNMSINEIKKFKKIVESTKEEPACKTYKYITIPNSPLGACNNINFIYTRAGGCSDEDLEIALKNKQSLLYSDGEAYGAYFYTAEDFGCIHYEKEIN